MKQYIKTTIVTLSLVSLVTMVSADWSAPASLPPNGNTDIPLNTGSAGQIKTGGLTVASGSVTYGFLVPNGKVGIGTLNPVSKLSVVGDVAATRYCDEAGSNCYNSTGGAIPSGAVMAFDLGSCPSGWTEYTTARGRNIIGAGATTIQNTGTATAGATSYTYSLGATGGENAHQLVDAELAKHAHGFNSLKVNNLKHSQVGVGGSTNRELASYSAGSVDFGLTGTMGNAGSDYYHNIMDPYVALLYCKKN